jgi:hypothetical protein
MRQSHVQSDTTSAWSPLRQPLFRSLWIASVASNIGTWMHDVGAVWLMTSLTPSPFMVALMQTATSLPFFLLALPAGALADVIDRRRILLATQGGMMAAAAALGTLTLIGVTTPWWLLALTFVLGLGAALNAPPWQAITPELVPPAEYGPVLVTVEYWIDEIHAGDFVQAMQEVRLERLRDGALRWELFHDPADPDRYVEAFLVESWVEHLRQHERVTLADREAEARARALHGGPTPVVVSHLVAVRGTPGKTFGQKA